MNPRFEIANLLFRIGIPKRKHKVFMLNLLKFFRDSAAHMPRGRVGKGKFRKIFLQPDQLFEEHVELVIADRRFR